MLTFAKVEAVETTLLALIEDMEQRALEGALEGWDVDELEKSAGILRALLAAFLKAVEY
jgi:hypothetical protein